MEYTRTTSKEEYYLNIAETVLERSTCLRRMYGAIIVKNDEIIATGYNGAPRGEMNCCDCGICRREALNIPKGERYELCVSVHAEANAIISAARKDMIGATMYIVGKERDGRYANPNPCMMCRRLIINAGIEKVIGRNPETGKAEELDLSYKEVKPEDIKPAGDPRMARIEAVYEEKMKRAADSHPSKRMHEEIHLLSQLMRLKNEKTIHFRQVENTFPVLFETKTLWDTLRELGIFVSGGRTADKHYDYIFCLASE